MKKLMKGRIVKLKIKTGNFAFDYIKDRDRWHLDHGEGVRVSSFPINLENTFVNAPQVVVSLRGIDTAENANNRILIEQTNVTKSDFHVDIKTWADSTVYGVTGSYIAIGD